MGNHMKQMKCLSKGITKQFPESVIVSCRRCKQQVQFYTDL